jgi:uncharacterized protein (TIGR02117 family)
VAALALVTAACVAAAVPPPAGEEAGITLWVLDHGWHTGIVVRRADVDRAIWPEVDELPEGELVEVAWGDADYYMAPSPTSWMAVRAALFSRGSVLHVTALDPATMAAVPERVQVRVTRGGFDALGRMVHQEYSQDAAGRPRRLQPADYGAGWFYAARSRYHLLNTCNTWVARALRAAGLPVDPSAAATSGGLMRQLREAVAAPGAASADTPPTAASRPIPSTRGR